MATIVIFFHRSLLLTCLLPLPFLCLSPGNTPILTVVFLVFCGLLLSLSQLFSVISHSDHVSSQFHPALNYFANYARTPISYHLKIQLPFVKKSQDLLFEKSSKHLFAHITNLTTPASCCFDSTIKWKAYLKDKIFNHFIQQKLW